MKDSPVSLAEQALSDAIERVRDAVGSTSDPRIALSEAAFWVFVLREFYCKTLSASRYFSLCEASPEGQASQAIMFARNKITHHLVDVLDVKVIPGAQPGAATPGASAPGSGRTKKYVRASLPIDEPPDDHSRDEYYREHVENRPLVPVLELVARFFEGLKKE